MTTKLLNQFKMGIKDLKLIPYKGGCFEVTVNGKLIWSKLETGKFPDEESLVHQVAGLSKAAG